MPYSRDKQLFRSRTTPGFTIVELLIVIVVIAILAAITIVAYSGIQDRARTVVLQNDLGNVAKQLMLDQVLNSAFPLTLAAANSGAGVKASANTTYQYSVNNSVNPQTFCVTASNGSLNYQITQDNSITAGVCPGHTAGGPVASVPTRSGYVDFSSTYTNASFTVDPVVTIPVGSWMVVVIAYTNSVVATPPAGWTTLITQDTTGTLQTAMFAKIKDNTDTNAFSITMSSGASTGNGVLLWGSGSAPVSSWILGALGKRASNGTSTTTVTPTVTTTTVNTLELSISTERTTVIEADITSIVGATKWVFVPQPDGVKIQTITIGYATQAQPGVTTPVTVTYPNAQTTNGVGFQLAIPSGG